MFSQAGSFELVLDLSQLQARHNLKISVHSTKLAGDFFEIIHSASGTRGVCFLLRWRCRSAAWFSLCGSACSNWGGTIQISPYIYHAAILTRRINVRSGGCGTVTRSNTQGTHNPLIFVRVIAVRDGVLCVEPPPSPVAWSCFEIQPTRELL